MNLPFGYEVAKKSNRMLIENVPVYRPIVASTTRKEGYVIEADSRTVASFSKDAKVKDIERVAWLDFESRQEGQRGAEKASRMRALVNEFWLASARL